MKKLLNIAICAMLAGSMTFGTFAAPLEVYMKGNQSDEVKEIQEMLIDIGYLEEGQADGIFGSKTVDAVKEFQKDYNIRVDGMVGKETLEALRTAAEEPVVAMVADVPPAATTEEAAEDDKKEDEEAAETEDKEADAENKEADAEDKEADAEDKKADAEDKEADAEDKEADAEDKEADAEDKEADAEDKKADAEDDADSITEEASADEEPAATGDAAAEEETEEVAVVAEPVTEEEADAATEETDAETTEKTDAGDKEDAAATEEADKEDAAATEEADKEGAAATEEADKEDAAATEEADKEDTVATEEADEEDAAATEEADEEDAAATEEADEEDAAATEEADKEDADAVITEDIIEEEQEIISELEEELPLDVDYEISFPSWNPDSEALAELIDFVIEVTDKSSPEYLEPEDRIATFDMDGTILCEKAPVYFDYCLTMHRVLDDSTYDATEEETDAMQQIRDVAYSEGTTFKPEGLTKDDLVASAFAGMTPEEFREYVVHFADSVEAVGFEGMTYGESFYKPMIEVIDFLRENDFDVWIVSACEREVVRALVDRFDIPYDHCIATDVPYVASNLGDEVADEYNMGQDETILLGAPLDEVECGKSGKPAAIAREIGRRPVLAFGNSSGDYSMLNYAEGNPDHKGMGFFVVCDDTVREYGSDEKAAEYYEVVEKEDWTGISMANDWVDIYGDDVQKVGLPDAEEDSTAAETDKTAAAKDKTDEEAEEVVDEPVEDELVEEELIEEELTEETETTENELVEETESAADEGVLDAA